VLTHLASRRPFVFRPPPCSDWSRSWGSSGAGAASGAPAGERAAASALAGAFPAAFDPEAVLDLPAPRPAAAAPAEAPPADAAVAATLAALEGALNRARPLTQFAQPGDRSPRAHGIHPLVVGTPMVDDGAARAAMALIYASATRGAARGLWPPLSKGQPSGGDGGGPLILSAPQASEAGVVEALSMALGGHDYTNINVGAPAAAPAAPAQVLLAPAALDGGAGASGSGSGSALRPAAGRGPTGAMWAKVQRGLPALPGALKEDLQVMACHPHVDVTRCMR
jgi:hypothetical protein